MNQFPYGMPVLPVENRLIASCHVITDVESHNDTVRYLSFLFHMLRQLKKQRVILSHKKRVSHITRASLRMGQGCS